MGQLLSRQFWHVRAAKMRQPAYRLPAVLFVDFAFEQCLNQHLFLYEFFSTILHLPGVLMAGTTACFAVLCNSIWQAV